MRPLGAASQGVLLAASTVLAVQALMVALSVLLRPEAARWANLVLASLAAVMVAGVISLGGFVFYRLLGLVEIALLLTIVWQAWRWPRVTQI